jgi:hypothetical protein
VPRIAASLSLVGKDKSHEGRKKKEVSCVVGLTST